MRKPYGKILSVASVVAGLCATTAVFADTIGVTDARDAGTRSPVNLQPDYNEDSGRYINSANNPAMHPDFNLVSEVNKVDIDFMATIVARYSLWDQTRHENFDFLNQLALFGVHMFKNGWSADLIVRFAGNSLREGNIGAPGTLAANTPVDKIGQVGIRKALIGYRFWHNKNSYLKIMLGRFAPYGATAYDDDNIVRAWGTDATVNLWGPNGSGDLHGTYVDGAALKYQGKWGHSRLNVGGGIASDLPIFLYMKDGATGYFNIHQNPYQAFGNDGSFGMLSTNSTRAWLADIAYMYSAKWGAIQFAVDAGGKTRAEQVSPNPFPVVTPPVNTPMNANNVYYVAGSLGYSLDNKIGVGVWYNWTHVGEGRVGGTTNPDGAVESYGPVGAGGTPVGNYSVFGVGLNGTSELWGWRRKDGVMTFGAGYQRYASRNGITSIYTAGQSSSSYDVNLFSGAIGYARGPATVELDYALFTSANQTLYRNVGQVANTANVIYLVGTFDI